MTAETIFIDAGGVLVEPNWARVADTLGRHGIATDASTLALAEPRAKLQLDVSRTIRTTTDASRAASYWHLVLEHAKVEADPPSLEAAFRELDAYHREHNLWENVIAGAQEALEVLGRAGKKRVLVSNSNGTVGKKLERLGLAALLDVIVDSGVVGVEKPDPRIFEIALEKSGAARETTVHVGDLFEVDVAGARAANITALLIDPHSLYADREVDRAESLLAFARRL